jgi:hypothetical protein
MALRASDIILNLSWVSRLPVGATSGCMLLACARNAALISDGEADGGTPSTANQFTSYQCKVLQESTRGREGRTCGWS